MSDLSYFYNGAVGQRVLPAGRHLSEAEYRRAQAVRLSDASDPYLWSLRFGPGMGSSRSASTLVAESGAENLNSLGASLPDSRPSPLLAQTESTRATADRESDDSSLLVSLVPPARFVEGGLADDSAGAASIRTQDSSPSGRVVSASGCCVPRFLPCVCYPRRNPSVTQRNLTKGNVCVAEPGGIFGVPLRQSITYANVAISLINGEGKSYIYGYVPIVVAKCGVFLKEKGTSWFASSCRAASCKRD